MRSKPKFTWALLACVLSVTVASCYDDSDPLSLRPQMTVEGPCEGYLHPDVSYEQCMAWYSEAEEMWWYGWSNFDDGCMEWADNVLLAWGEGLVMLTPDVIYENGIPTYGEYAEGTYIFSTRGSGARRRLIAHEGQHGSGRRHSYSDAQNAYEDYIYDEAARCAAAY